MEDWKLELKPGELVTWYSPCPPWYSITDVIQAIHHDVNSGYLSIKFQHHTNTIYTTYSYIERPIFSTDIVEDYAALTDNNQQGRTKEYSCWLAIKSRCYNANVPSYPRYGGRGITMCEQWQFSYSTFLTDVGFAPSKEHSLGRLDTTLGYFKANCKWMTDEEISNVRTSVLKITHGDLTLTTKEWGDLTGLRPNLIASRLKKGWMVVEALGFKVKTKHHSLTYNGTTLSIKKWSEVTGVSLAAIKSRLRRGWSIGRILGYING